MNALCYRALLGEFRGDGPFIQHWTAGTPCHAGGVFMKRAILSLNGRPGLTINNQDAHPTGRGS
jgi:hypothetical protein